MAGVGSPTAQDLLNNLDGVGFFAAVRLSVVRKVSWLARELARFSSSTVFQFEKNNAWLQQVRNTFSGTPSHFSLATGWVVGGLMHDRVTYISDPVHQLSTGLVRDCFLRT